MLGIKPTASLSLVLAVSLVVCCCSAIAEAAPVFDTTIVYAAGEDGYLTYRLPAIVSSTSGELFAFADAKKTSVLDNAATDLVLKTSSDNGQTWTNLQVVVPGGANYDGSASPLIDSSGNIIVTYLQTQGSTQQLFVTRSSDLGHTWSSPVDITTQVSDPTWNWHVLGPAHAIQLTSGRIIVSGDHRVTSDTSGTSYSFVAYSDDDGVTWHQGGSVATPNTNESQVAQLPNGNLYMTIRSVTGDYRLSSISTDGGITWSPATSTGLVEKSTEGSVIDYNVGAQNHLLLSSTNHYGDRRDLTLRTSLDSGGTWNSGNLIYDSASAYSDLALSPDQTVNLLYERGRFGTTIANVPNYYQQIALTRVNQEWLQTPQVVNTFLDFNEKTSGAASTVDAAILDSSGYALHAIAEGAPTYVAGDPRRGGSALHFQNVGDRVELTKADNLTTQFYYNVDYTMEVGFRTTNHGVGGEADAGILLANGNVSRSSATTWFVEVEDGRIHWEVTDSIGITSDLYGGANLSDGLWHDIAVRKTMTDGQYALFVDGQLVDSLTATIGNLVNFDSILVGQYDFTDKQFFGDIDFVRISDASLAPNQFVSVPEPSSLALAGLGALLLVCTVRLVPRKVQVC